jgi:hypothetical protein
MNAIRDILYIFLAKKVNVFFRYCKVGEVFSYSFQMSDGLSPLGLARVQPSLDRNNILDLDTSYATKMVTIVR